MVSITHFSWIVYPIYEEMMNGFVNRRMSPGPAGHTDRRGDEPMGLKKRLLLAAALVLAAVLSVMAVLDELGLLAA